MTRKPRRALRDRRGGAVLEAALLVPVLLFLAVMGTEVGFLVDAQVDVAAVAREAGRAAAMRGSAAAGEAAGVDTGIRRGLDPSALSVGVRRDGAVWVASVAYDYRFLAPAVGGLVGGEVRGETAELTAKAYFRAESP